VIPSGQGRQSGSAPFVPAPTCRDARQPTRSARNATPELPGQSTSARLSFAWSTMLDPDRSEG